MTRRIEMTQEKVSPIMSAPCIFCGNPINDEYRYLLTINGVSTYIGYCHKKCLRRAFDILLINKI